MCEGPVDPVNVAFAAGHVVVLSSISEGLPLTVIEAAMSGRPLGRDGLRWDGRAVGNAGIVVPARDPTASPTRASGC